MPKLNSPIFNFEYTSLDQRKVRSQESFSKIIKEIKSIVFFFIRHNFNNSLPSFTFSTVLKYFKPVFKKDD